MELPNFNPNKSSTWGPLLRVLAKWRLRGRTGLTIHALATLLDTKPEKLLRAFKTEPYKYYVYGQSCSVVGAVVWSVRLTGGAKQPLLLPLSSYYEDGATAFTHARQELRRWPWPKYTNIYGGIGCTKECGPVTNDLTRVLPAIAKGAPLIKEN